MSRHAVGAQKAMLIIVVGCSLIGALNGAHLMADYAASHIGDSGHSGDAADVGAAPWIGGILGVIGGASIGSLLYVVLLGRWQ